MSTEKIPSDNIYWRDLTKEHKVENRGNLFVSTLGKAKAVVFWHGQESKRAQSFLIRRSINRD